MKKLIAVAICALAVGWYLRAQAPSGVQYFLPSVGTTLANCGTPTSGFPLCGTGAGWFVWNGTAWVQLGVMTGVVTGISVNGGTPITGPTVQLNIPTKATSSTTTTIQ